MEASIEADRVGGAPSCVLGDGDTGSADRVDCYDWGSFSIYCKPQTPPKYFHNLSLDINSLHLS